MPFDNVFSLNTLKEIVAVPVTGNIPITEGPSLCEKVLYCVPESEYGFSFTVEIESKTVLYEMLVFCIVSVDVSVCKERVDDDPVKSEDSQ